MRPRAFAYSLLGSKRAKAGKLGRVGLLIGVAVSLISARPAAGAVAHYELAVSLDPETRLLQVAGSITIPPGRMLRLELDSSFRVERSDVDGEAMAAAPSADGTTTHWSARSPPEHGVSLHVRYAGELRPLQALDHRQVLGLAQPVCGPDGAFLPAGSGWYPEARGERLTYRIKVTVRGGFRAVVPGKLVHEADSRSGREATFESVHALPGIDLVAGPYVVRERKLALASGREVLVRTYFHPQLAELATEYIESASRYLAHYDRRIGPYAFDAYSIASSPLPTGFGMPGLAYLGRQVLRLPFIRATSLRHEVLHDWWGNGVTPDYAQGNWAEGLTTLLADYAYREEQGEVQAKAMRLGWLRDYAAVASERDRPLARFVSRRHGADQAVGYNKTAFVFFMLRSRIGADAFHAGLQSFWREHRLRIADWHDLQRTFEARARTDLSWFFEQWVHGAGAPLLEVAEARRSSDSGGHRVSMILRQQDPAFRLRVPLRIHHGQGSTHATVEMQGSRVRADIALPARALFVEIDPDVRLFRQLHPEEIAPTLRQVLLASNTRVAIAASDEPARSAALDVAKAALESDVKLLDHGSTQVSTPLLIVGLHAEIERLLERLDLEQRSIPGAEAGNALAYAWRTREGQPYVVVAAADARELAALARPLPHLGGQSHVVFDAGRSTARGLWPGQPRRYPVTD
jgi:aminopeptidase N